MKKLLFVLMLSIVTFGYSQEFLGIKVEGTLTNAIAKFKAKGFVLTEAQKNIVVMSGKLQSNNIDVVIVSSPQSRVVWKFSVALPNRTGWYTLENEYSSYVDIFTNKYGTPSSHYEYFTEPYYKGDGYEMQALSMEKATYVSYWLYDAVAYSVEMNKRGYIMLSYENRVNLKIHKKETDEQNYSIY